MFRATYAIHCSISRMRLLIRHRRSGNNMSFHWVMLCHLRVLGLAPLTIRLGFTRFPTPYAILPEEGETPLPPDQSQMALGGLQAGCSLERQGKKDAKDGGKGDKKDDRGR
ncbi:hypothetical protein JHK85_001079 [Glycine max]|nr:hypothetical protein JHK85_001079 [Glycine max]KAG5088434.1 hypothetical protein JHK86_001046 [Glycine max]